MLLAIEKEKLKTNFLTDPHEILECIQVGISIPILPNFRKYVIQDLKAYNAMSIVLERNLNEDYFGKKTDKIVGHVLVFDDGGDILFFGFFGTHDHDPIKIELLINALLNHARESGYKRIRGPINVPATIFGWGFMVEGSKKDLFIGSPINPPIYQELFFKKGFDVKFHEDRYDMPALKMDPHKNKKLIAMGINDGDHANDPFDSGSYPYEFRTPLANGREAMMAVKDEYVGLFADFMPPSAQITPKKSHGFDQLVEFVLEFGATWMMWTVRHKESQKMVACGYVVPDPFHLNKKGEINSISFHAWVVHPDHRRNYLAMVMYGFTSLNGKDRNTAHYITRGSWPVGAENEANGSAARKMGGKLDRSHLILEMEV